jgi:hypothetical protein
VHEPGKVGVDVQARRSGRREMTDPQP